MGSNFLSIWSLSIGLMCLALMSEASEYGQYETGQQSRIKLNLGLNVPPIVLKMPRMELPQLTIGANLIKRPNAKPLTINMPPMPQLSFGDSGGYDRGGSGYQHGSDYPKDQYSAGSQPNVNYEKNEAPRSEVGYMNPPQDMRTYGNAPGSYNSPNMYGQAESDPHPQHAPGFYPMPGPFPMPPNQHFLPPTSGPMSTRPHEMHVPMMPHANLLPPHMFPNGPPMPNNVQSPRPNHPQPYGPVVNQHALSQRPIQESSFGPGPAQVNHNAPSSGYKGPRHMESPVGMHSEAPTMNYPLPMVNNKMPRPSVTEVAPPVNLPPQQSFRLMPIAMEHSSNHVPQSTEQKFNMQHNEYNMHQGPAESMSFEPYSMITEEDLAKAYNAAPHRVPLRRHQSVAVAPMSQSMYHGRMAA